MERPYVGFTEQMEHEVSWYLRWQSGRYGLSRGSDLHEQIRISRKIFLQICIQLSSLRNTFTHILSLNPHNIFLKSAEKELMSKLYFEQTQAQIVICLKPLDWSWKQNLCFLILNLGPCLQQQESKGRAITHLVFKYNYEVFLLDMFG